MSSGQLHQYYTTRSENPLKKKQLLILLCCKLIRIIFALLIKQVAYDPQKMSDIKRSLPAAVRIQLFIYQDFGWICLSCGFNG